MLTNGFNTLCDKFNFPYYLLTKTYRLLPNSAALTSIFYSEPLISVNNESHYESKLPYINKKGGTSIRLLSMPIGEKADLKSGQYVIDLVIGDFG